MPTIRRGPSSDVPVPSTRPGDTPASEIPPWYKPPGRQFNELNPGGGGVSGIPTGSAEFTPTSVWGNLPAVDRGPFPEGAVYNPYGISRPGESYGKSAIYGGPRDLMKSVATRSLAVALMDQQMKDAQAGGTPPGLSGALQNFAANRGGGLLNEELTNNITPRMETASYMNNRNYQNTLSNLMQNAFIQGGQLLGQSKLAWAQAKDVDKRRREQKNAAIKQWVGAFLPQEAGIRDIGQGGVGMGA